MDYNSLVTEIESWVNNASVNSRVPTFIELFEAQANRTLRVRQMEAEATATAAEFLDFPTDYLELRDIEYDAAVIAQLQYVNPEYADIYNSTKASGTPKFYTVVGNRIRLVPPPSSGDTTVVRISYWQQIPALQSNSTNWLIAAYPDAYLYGSLMHARAWLQDIAMVQAVQQGYASVMNEIQSSGKRSNFGGSLAIRPG